MGLQGLEVRSRFQGPLHGLLHIGQGATQHIRVGAGLLLAGMVHGPGRGRRVKQAGGIQDGLNHLKADGPACPLARGETTDGRHGGQVQVPRGHRGGGADDGEQRRAPFRLGQLLGGDGPLLGREMGGPAPAPGHGVPEGQPKGLPGPRGEGDEKGKRLSPHLILSNTWTPPFCRSKANCCFIARVGWAPFKGVQPFSAI